MIRFIAALIIVFSVVRLADADTDHKLAIHVNENNPRLFNEILTNIENLQRHYDELDEGITFEIVAYGGGIEMLISGTSPVEDRLDYLSLAIDDLRLTACGNTLNAMKRSTGEKPPLIEGVEIAQTGIARIIELQEKGYSYIKP